MLNYVLLPLAAREEFDKLPDGYFWFHDLKLDDGTLVRPIAFDARNKEQMIAILRRQIKCMSLCDTSMIADILPKFRWLLYAIENNMAKNAPFEVIQKLKAQGVYLLPEDALYVTDVSHHTDDE